MAEPAPPGTGPEPSVAVVVVPAGDVRHEGLVRAAEAELLRRYGDGSLEPPEGLPHPADDEVVRLLAQDADGVPLGCAVVAPLPSAGPLTGELKRLFVLPGARRRGVASVLLAAARDAARDRGLAALHLVTGTLQPEAIALYEREGWRPIPPYAWADDPMSRSFAVDLGPAT